MGEQEAAGVLWLLTVITVDIDLYLENRIHQTNHIQDDKNVKDRGQDISDECRQAAFAMQACLQIADGIWRYNRDEAKRDTAQPNHWSFAGVLQHGAKRIHHTRTGCIA